MVEIPVLGVFGTNVGPKNFKIEIFYFRIFLNTE